MVVSGPAVRAGPVVPAGNGPLVKPVGGDDGLGRAAVSQQGGDGDEQGAVLVKAVEGGALGGTEGLAAAGTAQAPLLVGVDLDVTAAGLAPGRAGGAGTECLGGGPGVPPFRSRLASLPVTMFPAPPLPYPPS